MSLAGSSDHRFRTFVAAAPVGIYECDSEGGCLFVNKRWCALTGLTARQAAGEGWVKAIHPDDHDRVAAGWRHATSTGVGFTGEEYRFQRPDGSVTWVSGSAVALRGSDGEIAGYLGTCEDITERKRAQEGLERDARSFDISRDLLIEVQFDGVLERVNSASMAILGWRPEEMIGQPYTNFVHPDDADLSEEEMARLAAGGTTVAFRNRYRTPEGAWRWLEWNAVGIPEEGRLYAAGRDITERLELEAELQREHRQLENAQSGLKEAEEIARLGSWDWDVVADSVTWSDGMHALYGTDAGNFPATLAAMVEPIHVDDRRRIQAQARAAVVDGLPYEIEYRLLRADGELRWHSGRGRPHLGTDGNVVRIVGTLQDVTEQKQGELLLQASELRYRSVGENLPSTSVLIFDSELRCIAAMGGALRRHGRTAGELIGRRFDELAADPKAQALLRAHLPAVLAGETRHWEARTSDGVATYAHQAGPLPDGEGGVVAAILVSYDISDRKRMEQELERSNGELERFAYVASHDLQAPLRVVTGFLSLLESRYADQLGKDGAHFIELAGAGAQRMLELIRGLLEFSRVGEGKRPAEEIDTAALVDGVLSDLAPAIEEAGAVVEVGPLPAVRGDRANIARLMQNLLSNAIKFRDGLVPQIRIDGRRLDADLVQLSVTDNGIGIPPEHAETIFHTYKRLHPANDYDGTGLGLAICRRIVERHGGSIRVEPAEPQGARFVLTLAVPDSR